MADYLTETEADRLSRLVRYFESAEQATSDARALAEKCRDYYDGDQWTEEELAALKKRKQPAITINRIKPKVDFLLGMETQRRSLPKASPRTPKHEHDAEAATDALRYVIEDQRFDVTRSKGFENLCIEGVVGADVCIKVQPNGEKKILVLPIEWDRIFYDEHSRKRNFSDAKYFGQVIWADYDDAVTDYPEKVGALSSTLASENATNTYADVPRTRWADPKRKRVRIVEIWHLEGGKWYHCIFTKGGILVEEESPYTDEEGNTVPGFILGSAFIDRDGNRYSPIKNWIPIQDEINKRRSKAQHLLSVRQVQYEKGAVDDVNRMRQELAKPDGAVEVNPGLKFEALNTGDMAAAQFNLLQEAKQEIDAVGVNASLSGTEGRQMSGRALLARQESGLAELGPLFDALKQWQLDVYRAIWHRIRQYWTDEKWIRVTDDENNVRFVGLNKPMKLGEVALEMAQKRGIEITQEMQMQAMHDPAMQQVAEIRNNVAELDVDIEIDDAPASASLQAEQFEALAGMAKNGIPIPPEAIIKASNLRNKEEIIKMMKGGQDLPPQVQQQLQQMSEQLSALQHALQDKAAEQDLKAREVGVKEYDAETKRLTATQPAMDPMQIQAIVIQTVKDILSGNMPPMEAPSEPQEPVPEPMEPPGMPEPQDTPPQGGFFMPEQNQAPGAMPAA